LNFPLQGRFDLFAHHIAKTDTPDDTPTLYLGVMLYNPGRVPVHVDLLQAASYLGTPDAPFIELASLVDNPLGSIYSGPGSRVTNQVLRGRRQTHWPSQLLIPSGQSRMLINLPIPVPKLALSPRQPVSVPQLPKSSKRVLLASQATPLLEELPPLRNLAPSSNGRSTLLYLFSSGPVYAASLAMYARLNPDGHERIPTLEDWQFLLETGGLANPRDIAPTPPGRTTNRFFYGRVAGVSQGSQWQAQLTDNPKSQNLTIPKRDQAFSYGLSTVERGNLGTGQIQSAPMLVRYPDTAYLAHGNYAVHYDLSLPLYNSTNQPQAVALLIQTPLKQGPLARGLRFLEPPLPQIFFRGTVRIRYDNDQGVPQTHFVHLVQRQGQQGDPLVILHMKPGERRLVKVDYLYPPDSTPPQVLTVKTLANPSLGLPFAQTR
jgi:hypothetical protein